MRLALRNVMGSLSDVGELAGRAQVAAEPAAPHTCQLLNCPRGAQLVAAMQETVFVLEETRSHSRARSCATCARSWSSCSSISRVA
jgi:hypothetical protein